MDSPPGVPPRAAGTELSRLDPSQMSPPHPVTGRDVLRILRRHGLLAITTFTVVVAAALLFTARMKPVYEASASVLLKNPGMAMPASLMDIFSMNNGNSLDAQIEILRSRGVLAWVIRVARLKTSPEELGSRFQAGAAGGGQILVLRVRADSGEEAARTANAFARVFREYTRQQEDKDALGATRRLRQQLRKSEREKDAAQRTVNAFMKATGSSNPIALFERRAAQTADVRAGLDSAVVGLQSERTRRQQLARQINTLDRTRVVGYGLVQNPVLREYRKRLYDLQVQREQLLQPGNFTEESDEVRDVDRQMASLKEQIAAAQKREYSIGDKSVSEDPNYAAALSGYVQSGANIVVAEESIRANQALLVRLQAEQRVLAERKGRYEQLQRNLQSAVALHNRIRESITAIDANRTTAAPAADILDAARAPGAPISPKPLLNALMAVFLGLFLAIGAALLAEYLSATGEEDQQAMLLPQVAGVPLLGTIPIALPAPENNSELPVPVHAASLRAEDALREVGYQLVRLGHKKGAPPVVTFVGTRTDDTAAGVAAQLTAILVRDGMRVTLVDADRAHPCLHRVFGAPDAPGLSDVLAGRKRASEVLHVGADGSLRFLAAGSPDDAAAPATERGLRSVFKDLAAQTDLIVVRGPSVWTVPAMEPLQRATDGLVLVASPDAPPAESVARARRLLTNGHRPNILGVVAGELPGSGQPAAKETTG